MFFRYRFFTLFRIPRNNTTPKKISFWLTFGSPLGAFGAPLEDFSSPRCPKGSKKLPKSDPTGPRHPKRGPKERNDLPFSISLTFFQQFSHFLQMSLKHSACHTFKASGHLRRAPFRDSFRRVLFNVFSGLYRIKKLQKHGRHCHMSYGDLC